MLRQFYVCTLKITYCGVFYNIVLSIILICNSSSCARFEVLTVLFEIKFCWDVTPF